MSNLKSTIERLASQFAVSVIEALRNVSIDEIYEVARGGAPARGRPRAEAPEARRRSANGGRLARRSADDIGRMIDSIVELLQKNPEGLRAEQIREALECEAKELPRPLADAVEQGRITKTGQKRATTYFAGGAEGAGPKRRARRSGGRRKRA